MKKLLLLIALSLAMTGTAAAQGTRTRYGTLDVDNDVLTFKGRPVKPEVKGSAGLSLLDKFRMGATDVVLVRDNGGTACPARSYFVTVSADGAKVTHSFGTCSDHAEAFRRGETITVTMPGYQGPFNTAAERAKAAKEKHVFVLRDGAVTENGKPAK